MTTFVRTQQIGHQIGPSGTFSLRITNGAVELNGVDGDLAEVRAAFGIRAGSDAEADELFEPAQLQVVTSPTALDVAEHELATGRRLAATARRSGVEIADLRVEADIPRGAQVRIDVISADVVAHDLIGPQRYRTVSGDLILNDVAGDLRLRGVSGDITVRAVGDLGLEANTVSGDLSVVAPRYRSMRASTVSGNVELEGELGADQDHHVETLSGDLMIGLVGGMSLEVRGLSTDATVRLPHREEGYRDRRRYVVGDGSASLLFTSMSGDVLVGPPRRSDHRPPSPPAPPAPPAAPGPAPSAPPLDDDERLRILRALEAGEIDVDEAAQRLARG